MEILQKIFSVFYGSCLKGNPYLDFAVITGITYVGRYRLLEALNHLYVKSILSNNVNDYYGFIEEEVFRAMIEYGLDNYEEVRKWYNGYIFGANRIYNPWSIINYLKGKKVDGYWVQTSTDGLIVDYFKNGRLTEIIDFKELMEGKYIVKKIEKIIEPDDFTNYYCIYSILLYAGYITAKPYQENLYKVIIVNYEIKDRIKQIVRSMSLIELGNVDKIEEH